MATQFINQATSNVTIAGKEVSFQSNTVTAQLLDSTLLTMVKTQSTELVVSGGTITYTIVITNLSLAPLVNFEFEDIIPTGMSYETGSFRVNGLTKTPVISDQTLSYNFDILPIALTTVSFVCNVA